MTEHLSLKELERLAKNSTRVEFKLVHKPKHRKNSKVARSRVELIGFVSSERIQNLINQIKIFRQMAKRKMI